ncbi:MULTISPECIES: asparagine synthetase B [unclassified Spirosoma]|uniref:asparagine synthetase B n=1 Tax=unclassified Spirosoma TaxID=2621999 RepID=UPI00095ECEB0|nr:MULTISPECIES: asparagine synthetase B [unclassified Spirosoma]MBN8823529.1 asparagine synthetase B [Spirosoma sp.]OJW71863.1 MAG: asparagine synthetase B [Spirosoma sp. 48-14]
MKQHLTFLLVLLAFVGWAAPAWANYVLIPMDDRQTNHLKAYGIAYKVLKDDQDVEWLLNYRGGSFMMKYTKSVETECRVRGVSFEGISDSQAESIRQQLSNPDVNMDVVKLQKAAKIIVYSPAKVGPAEFENTDAVLLVLTYAEIPYELVYDEEVLKGDLPKYDWLHLHHEDFTGQYGRNMHRQSLADIKAQEDIARKYGYSKVSQMKLAVAKGIKQFCAGGGYLFAMCSAAETLDIALAADGVDIVSSNYDGDGMDPNAQEKLDFSKTFAFGNFTLESDNGYRGFSTFSDINSAANRGFDEPSGFFELFNFSAKWDAIPSMLTQNHENIIKEFFGQTTAFRKGAVKPSSLVMGEGKTSDRYLYGEMGKGQWTFYGGHDPEGTRGGGFRNPTDLNLHPHSAGYRLILNNVLFPSARKKKRKT